MESFKSSHLGRYGEHSGLFPGWTAAPKKTEQTLASFWQLNPTPASSQVTLLESSSICIYQTCFVLSENQHEHTRLRLLFASFFLCTCLAGCSARLWTQVSAAQGAPCIVPRARHQGSLSPQLPLPMPEATSNYCDAKCL